MNVTYFIFRLLHIHNHPIFSVLTPLCLPYTPFVNYARLFVDCEDASGDCTDFSIDCAHNSDDCVNTLDD
jgi:hypothetical protein